MKVTLPAGRVAQVGVKIGNEQPDLDRPLPVAVAGKPFRSVRIELTVTQDGQELGRLTGISYCNPLDQFCKATGRQKALRRLLQLDTERSENLTHHRLLSKADRAILCPAILCHKVCAAAPSQDS